MSQCIYIQPDGLVRASAEAPSECAGYVLLTREEYQEAVNPLFQPLSIEGGLMIAMAVIGLWIAAFVIRLIRGMLLNQSGDSNL